MYHCFIYYQLTLYKQELLNLRCATKTLFALYIYIYTKLCNLDSRLNISIYEQLLAGVCAVTLEPKPVHPDEL